MNTGIQFKACVTTLAVKASHLGGLSTPLISGTQGSPSVCLHSSTRAPLGLVRACACDLLRVQLALGEVWEWNPWVTLGFRDWRLLVVWRSCTFSIHLGASWVGSPVPLSSGSLCLEGHTEETITEVPVIKPPPPLTQTPLSSFTEGEMCVVPPWGQ